MGVKTSTKIRVDNYLPTCTLCLAARLERRHRRFSPPFYRSRREKSRKLASIYVNHYPRSLAHVFAMHSERPQHADRYTHSLTHSLSAEVFCCRCDDELAVTRLNNLSSWPAAPYTLDLVCCIFVDRPTDRPTEPTIRTVNSLGVGGRKAAVSAAAAARPRPSASVRPRTPVYNRMGSRVSLSQPASFLSLELVRSFPPDCLWPGCKHISRGKNLAPIAQGALLLHYALRVHVVATP